MATSLSTTPESSWPAQNADRATEKRAENQKGIGWPIGGMFFVVATIRQEAGNI